MRRILKGEQAPKVLTEWIAAQLAINPPVNLGYNSFGGTKDLRDALIAEQHGLCAFTGMPIDERLPPPRPDDVPKLSPHIDHLKPQSVCRREKTERSLVVGEDMDYRNMVAAVQVSGARVEQFGAALRGDRELPIWPTHEGCDRRFSYGFDGSVAGADDESRNAIQILGLTHKTLRDARRGAISGWLPNDADLTRHEWEDLAAKLETPANGKLSEYAFCVSAAIRNMLFPSRDSEGR